MLCFMGDCFDLNDHSSMNTVIAAWAPVYVTSIKADILLCVYTEVDFVVFSYRSEPNRRLH